MSSCGCDGGLSGEGGCDEHVYSSSGSGQSKLFWLGTALGLTPSLQNQCKGYPGLQKAIADAQKAIADANRRRY